MSLPQMVRYWYPNRTEDLVDLMVDELGHQSVEATMEVLTDMNRPDLMLRLSESSSGRKTERSSELEGCQSLTQDCSDWTKLEPEVNSTDADEAPTYSLQSAAGHFECRVSGLRWVCKGKTSFQYQFRSWEGHMERMESRQYMPAGPLMDVTVTAGKLNEVHLPHWICIDDIPDILDTFAVLHIDDCGDVVEKVSEVTPTHVKLTEPIFSPRAVLMKLGVPVKIGCNVLIYQTNTAFLTLHVYLIPRDPGLQQVMKQREVPHGYKAILKPDPEKSLKILDRFTLTADVDGAEICPEDLKLRYPSGKPNFFEVYTENPDGNFHLKLTSKKDLQPVWTCTVRKEENTVDKHLSAQMQKVLTVQSDRERIMEILEHLEKKDLKKFKWLLVELKPIPKSELEDANICDLVDLMFGAYTQHTVEVTKEVFRKMNRNDLVQKLSDTSSRSKD
uniref:NACHT, LRR and PYD domains-containing protein 1b allele 5 isoform X6 n=1 Tax=Maylandia zebra TaxID=106582 RepID=UPI000D31FE4F|nr:NACHT, LRR and PYD domains-containing protein 1b allele 5-like isoform X6 [Maylandia zebra]